MPRRFTEQEREQFLAAKHIAVISVAADDGRPPSSLPIWYGYEPGGDILINTGGHSRKAKLIEKTGKATITVQQEELPYQYVVVEGTVVDIQREVPRETRVAIAERYLGKEGGEQFVDTIPAGGQVLFTIRPDRWHSVDYSEDW